MRENVDVITLHQEGSIQSSNSLQLHHPVHESSQSIDHYSKISQSSNEYDEVYQSYQSLDQKSVVEFKTRQPAVYDELGKEKGAGISE